MKYDLRIKFKKNGSSIDDFYNLQSGTSFDFTEIKERPEDQKENDFVYNWVLTRKAEALAKFGEDANVDAWIMSATRIS